MSSGVPRMRPSRGRRCGRTTRRVCRADPRVRPGWQRRRRSDAQRRAAGGGLVDAEGAGRVDQRVGVVVEQVGAGWGDVAGPRLRRDRRWSSPAANVLAIGSLRRHQPRGAYERLRVERRELGAGGAATPPVSTHHRRATLGAIPLRGRHQRPARRRARATTAPNATISDSTAGAIVDQRELIVDPFNLCIEFRQLHTRILKRRCDTHRSR